MLRVGIVLFPGFQVMNLGMTSVLEFANLEMSEPLYDFVLLWYLLYGSGAPAELHSQPDNQGQE